MCSRGLGAGFDVGETSVFPLEVHLGIMGVVRYFTIEEGLYGRLSEGDHFHCSSKAYKIEFVMSTSVRTWGSCGSLLH